MCEIKRDMFTVNFPSEIKYNDIVTECVKGVLERDDSVIVKLSNCIKNEDSFKRTVVQDGKFKTIGVELKYNEDDFNKKYYESIYLVFNDRSGKILKKVELVKPTVKLVTDNVYAYDSQECADIFFEVTYEDKKVVSDI